MEVQAFDIHLAHDKVSLLHIYNSPDFNLNEEHFGRIVRQLRRKYIIVGDFNAHHHIWDPTNHPNQRGRALVNYMIDHPNMALSTPSGLITYTSPRPPHNPSTIDLTLCSNNLIQIIQTSALADSGSDHFPVLNKIELAPDPKTREKRKRWKDLDKKMGSWQSKLKSSNNISDNVDILEEEFTKSLIDAAENTFKKTNDKIKTKFCRPWWNSECSRAVAQRRRARRRAERNPTLTNTIDLRRCTAKAKKIIKKTKRETWRKFCSTITSETPTKQIWDMVKKLNGKKTYNDMPLKEHGAIIFDNQKKADILANTLDELLGEEPPEADYQHQQEVQNAKHQQSDDEINSHFTMNELRECLNSLENNKSAGEDEVMNNFLKNLPDFKMTEFLRLINKSWRTSIVPKNWKNALIIPIHKPGKESSDPKSYRPISLLSSAAKVAEKLVNTRLQWHMEKKGKNSPTQFGFRPGHSTEDLLVNLDHQIRSTLVNKKVTVAIFFDLKNAFDTINHDHILYKLTKSGIHGNMLCWIEQFLQKRTYQVIVGNSTSGKKEIKRGVPQGSCLSPTLFNIIMSDIPHTDGIIIGEYADDIAILITSDSLEDAHTRAQAAITELATWANKWCLTFNTTKTKSMCFTKKKISEKLQNPIFQLKLNQDNIEWTKEMKYLGVTLDAPTLTWKLQYEDLVKEGVKRINIMQAISGTTWGANTELLLNFYKAYIRSKISYAIPATASSCHTRKLTLERVQNAAMRVALGARKTSPIVALQVESSTPPLLDHFETLCLQYYHRSKGQEAFNPLVTQLENDEETRDRVWTRSHFKKPLVRQIPDISRDMIVPTDLQIRTVKIPNTPPWRTSAIKLSPDLNKETTKEDSNERKKAIALDTINNLYPNHLKIYTDGSKIENSTSAGLWIPDFHHRENWKLDHGRVRSIMSAELYAIDKGMTWLLLHQEILDTNLVVFLTDSRSSIEAMKNYNPKHQSNLLNKIKEKALDLETDSNINITIQYIPAHVGIEGNEEADLIAKNGHNNQDTIPADLDYSEVKVLIKAAQYRRWQLIYDTQKHEYHIGQIKPIIQKWPWTAIKNRKIETAMSKLRLGHAGLNHHLNKFDMADSPLCDTCREPETITHYLLSCRRYDNQRIRLNQALNRQRIFNPDICTLLGGGEYSPEVKVQIIKSVGNYIQETGRADSL